MNELINIKTEDGKQFVSARELYKGLELARTKWTPWYQKNIENNEFFHQTEDWRKVSPEVTDNVYTIDFEITTDFAKHLAMMARTEKSHQYRNYFIECEKQVKEAIQPKLSKELQAIFVIDQRTVAMNNRLGKLEDNMTIDYSQQEELRTAANKKAIEVLGGKDAPAYKECSKKTFSELWKSYKRILHVNSYRNTATKEYERAKQIIKTWEPNRDLQLMILGANSQTKISI